MQTSLLRYRLSLFFFNPAGGGGRNKNDRGEGGEGEQRNEGDRIITTLSCKLADIDVVRFFFLKPARIVLSHGL